jgi:mutator protein MutT
VSVQKNNGSTLVVAAIIHRSQTNQSSHQNDLSANQEVLIVRRGPAMSGAGHWEFPGGKVEPGESEPQALLREISEELGIRIRGGRPIGETIHQYTAKKVHLKFYLVPMPVHEQIILVEHDAMKWILPKEIDIESMSEADRSILETLQQIFS